MGKLVSPPQNIPDRSILFQTHFESPNLLLISISSKVKAIENFYKFEGSRINIVHGRTGTVLFHTVLFHTVLTDTLLFDTVLTDTLLFHTI